MCLSLWVQQSYGLKQRVMATKKIPYGMSDFQTISTKNYYYVDKTRFIEKVEQCHTSEAVREVVVAGDAGELL